MADKKTKQSKFTTALDKIYPKDKSRSKSALSKHFKIPMSVLNDVYDRGLGAARSTGMRPSVKSPQQWARARMSKLIVNIVKARKGGRINKGKGQDSDLIEKVVKKN